MFEAIKSGDPVALRELIDSGADVDQRDTPLDEDAAKRLRRSYSRFGESVIEGQNLAFTPLMLACKLGRIDSARILLDEGADLDLRSALGDTPLCLAVGARNAQVVDLLVRRGANPNDKDALGMPALTLAFASGSLEIARGLLDAGASVTPRCKKDYRPLPALIALFPTISRRPGHAIQKTPSPAKDFDTGRALALARELLPKGIKGDARVLLSSAVTTDEPDLLRILVDAGADWRLPTEAGNSLINWAVFCGALRVFELLVEWGADLNDGEGSILLMPVVSGDLALLKRLIEVGADVDARLNSFGETPLMRSASLGKLEILQALIFAGAELDRSDDMGRTALSLAEGNKNLKTAAVLINAGASRDRQTTGSA